jgi:putative ATP-dependent endonuclease of OLD family
MYISEITIEGFRCFGYETERLVCPLTAGLTALVGENDVGKTAVLDAIRLALGTTDQEWFRLEDTDFHEGGTAREIRIICKFEGLTTRNKRAFVEYLTYGKNKGDEPILYVNCTVTDTGEIRRGWPYRRVEVCSGKNGDGPNMVEEVRRLLRATYLRPLRDAEQALSAGRGSRLAQVLQHSQLIQQAGGLHDPNKLLREQKLSVLAIGGLLNELLEKQTGVVGTRGEIDGHLDHLFLTGDPVESRISVSDPATSVFGSCWKSLI